MSDRYTIMISDAAVQLLYAHINFVAQESPSAAHNLKEKIMTAINSLSTNPYRFPIYENQFIYNARYHKMVISKNYLALYKAKEKTIYIELIIDSHQEIEKILSKD